MTETTTAIAIRSEEERVAVVDRARAMLERARTPIEAKQIHDLAKAAEVYARLQKAGEEAVRHAQAIAVDALALMGEMLKAVEKSAGMLKVGPVVPAGNHGETQAKTQTLAEQGITKKQSMLAQSLATAKETQPTLFDAVKAGEVSITAAHAEVKKAAAEPTGAAVSDPAPPVSGRRSKVHKKPSHQDPDHPHRELLQAFVTLATKVSAAINDEPADSLLRQYLLHIKFVFPRAKIVRDKHYGWQCVGLRGVYRIIDLAGKRTKKPLTKAQIQKLFDEANDPNTEAP